MHLVGSNVPLIMDGILPPFRKIFDLVNHIKVLPKHGKYPYSLDRNGAGKTFIYETINLCAELHQIEDIFPMISTMIDGRYDWCGYDYNVKSGIVHKLHGKCGEQ